MEHTTIFVTFKNYQSLVQLAFRNSDGQYLAGHTMDTDGLDSTMFDNKDEARAYLTERIKWYAEDATGCTEDEVDADSVEDVVRTIMIRISPRLRD